MFPITQETAKPCRLLHRTSELAMQSRVMDRVQRLRARLRTGHRRKLHRSRSPPSLIWLNAITASSNTSKTGTGRQLTNWQTHSILDIPTLPFCRLPTQGPSDDSLRPARRGRGTPKTSKDPSDPEKTLPSWPVLPLASFHVPARNPQGECSKVLRVRDGLFQHKVCAYGGEWWGAVGGVQHWTSHGCCKSYGGVECAGWSGGLRDGPYTVIREFHKYGHMVRTHTSPCRAATLCNL